MCFSAEQSFQQVRSNVFARNVICLHSAGSIKGDGIIYDGLFSSVYTPEYLLINLMRSIATSVIYTDKYVFET